MEETKLKEVRRENILNKDETKEQYQKRLHEKRANGFTERSLHGKFKSSIEGIADQRSWEWLKMGYLKKCRAALITAAHDQALRTNWIKAKIDKQDCSPKCGICQQEDESAMHTAIGCQVLAN